MNTGAEGRSVTSTRASILHVDVDAFFASVEQLDDPSLRGRPVIVGGLGPRGVVAAASYEARAFGVHSATPMVRARRACPDGVFLAPRFERYAEMSGVVMAILRSFTPLVEPLSLDEAFLDVRGATRIFGDGPAIACAIREQVRREAGLAVSVGVASSKHLAKIASDLAKPDGLLVIDPREELTVLHSLDVSRLWGVGPATRRVLARLGVRTVAELAHLDEGTLAGALGAARARHLRALAWNRDERSVQPSRVAKSIGTEETFATDRFELAVLDSELLRLAHRLAGRLRASGVRARTVQLKVRFADFHTITRARTLPTPTDLGEELARVGRGLLAALDVARGIRLLGLSAQQLSARDTLGRQLLLALDAQGPSGLAAEDGETRGARLAASVDRARRRYVDTSIQSARFVPTPRHTDQASVHDDRPPPGP